MDGRVQLPVNAYLKKRFNVDYVDTVTEPGPNGILAKQSDPHVIGSIFERVRISVEKHASAGIAIVGHHDCAGNPVEKENQLSDIRDSIEFIRKKYNRIPVVGLWVDENWVVQEVA